MTSPFLSLPLELRLQIYTLLLAPTGHLHLTSSPTHRFTIQPRIYPSILATSRQIQHEATPLLYTHNELCLTLNAHDTCWPLISEARIAQRALEKVSRVFLLLDCVGRMAASYADVDFAPLEALVSVRWLRVAVLEDAVERWWQMEQVGRMEKGDGGEEDGEDGEDGENVLVEVLRRVPKNCEVVYGTVEGSAAREVVEAVCRDKMKGRRVPVREVDRDLLEEGAQKVPDGEKGVRSGVTKDVFWEARQQYLATR